MLSPFPASPPAHSISRRRLLVIGALCWTVFAIVSGLMVTGQTVGFDTAGLMALRRGDDLHLIGGRIMLEMVRDITALGGVFLRNMAALGAAVVLIFYARRREAMFVILTVASGWAVNSAFKHFFDRERPQIVPHLMEAGGASFPSGHSFNAAVVYFSIAFAFAAISRGVSARYTLFITALGLSVAVAWSRVILGVHYPSDVTAGLFGGVAWTCVMAAMILSSAGTARIGHLAAQR